MEKSTVKRARGAKLRRSVPDVLFDRASRQWEAGKLRSAFRLFLASAKAGYSCAQVNLGAFYRDGIGMKPNRARALYWLLRAHRNADRLAAANIGVIFRDEGNPRKAVEWFERSGDGDAYLPAALMYLQAGDQTKAAQYLRKTLKANPKEMTEASREEAEALLRKHAPDALAEAVKKRWARPQLL